MKLESTNKKKEFIINNKAIFYEDDDFPIKINSFPHPYQVEIVRNLTTYSKFLQQADFIIIDSNILKIYKVDNIDPKKVFIIEAKEENKNLSTVECLIKKLINCEISKGSMVIAVGGGIIQDISACACALFRRGQPFTYFPTTTLGQLDSCVGAKCAINTLEAKNILGLFSAPRNVKIPIFMIKSMPKLDHIAGLSEMFRLCLTCSDDAVEKYFYFINHLYEPDRLNFNLYIKAIRLSLSIKKSVVDFDEYEKDVRRSMNYGHTFGHALEKYLDFRLPHGIAVLIGMHIANIYSNKIKILPNNILKDLQEIFRKTAEKIKPESNYIKDIKPKQIIELFKFDKKGDGSSVPLVLLKKPGEIIFKRHYFSSENKELENSIQIAKDEFHEWINF